MGVIKMYLLIMLTFNHSHEVASLDLDSLLRTGINFVGDSWNKFTNFVSDTVDSIKGYIIDNNGFDNIDSAYSQRYRRPRKFRFRKLGSTGYRFKATQIHVPLGYRLESHIVLSLDGYILKLHRLLRTGANSSCSTNKTALLHHGLLGSSADWLLLGVNHSLPLLLSDEGYDVWLANARGNDCSNDHLNQNNIQDYWEFSFQEMGQYDLPSVIEYIIKVKKAKIKIDFIGHSMGASAFLVLTSTMPKYQEYFNTAVLLAPLAYMSKAEGPLKILAAIPFEQLEAHGKGEFFPKRTIPKWMAKKYCVGSKNLCSNPLFFLTGVPNLDAKSEARVQKFVPAGGSTKTIAHYAKIVKNGLFTSFMGSEFPIGRITVPTFLMSSQGDMISKAEEVSKLFENLARPVHHHVINENFRHTDFMWSNQAKTLVFDKVIEFLNGSEDTLNTIEENEIIPTKTINQTHTN